jgi:hypothetical protein
VETSTREAAKPRLRIAGVIDILLKEWVPPARGQAAAPLAEGGEKALLADYFTVISRVAYS